MLPGHVTRGRPNPLHHRFDERLRRARKKAGKSASGLALAAGLDKNAVSRLEAGGLPRLPTVEQLARALGVSPGWLGYGVGESAATTEQGPLRCTELAARVRETRGDLAVRELARRAQTSPAQVRAVESGNLPTIENLEDLARALGVSPAWLAFGEGDRELRRRGARSQPLENRT